MTIRYLLDADLPKILYRALRRHTPGLDVVRVQQVGLRTAEDLEILEYAGSNNRILVSRDKRTMRQHAADRVATGLPMCGLLLLRRDFAAYGRGIGILVLELELIAGASDPEEWKNVTTFIPYLYWQPVRPS